MNHPKREEWVPYLFGETKPEAARQLNAHLKTCPECQESIVATARKCKFCCSVQPA